MEVKGENKEELLTFSWRDLGIAVLIFCICTASCVFLMKIRQDDPIIPLLFGAAVFLTALCTDGFLFGMGGSLLGMVLIFLCFPHPDRPYSIGIVGFALTGLCLFLLAFLTCCLKERRKQAIALQKEAERRQQRDTLLRTVSEELYAPLRAILRTNAVFLEKGELYTEKQTKQMLREIRQDAEWISRLQKELLTLEEMGVGASLKKQPEAVEEVVGEAVWRLRRHFPEVRVRVTVPPELFLVPMDAILIELALLELLKSAAPHGRKEEAMELCVRNGGGFAEFRLRGSKFGVGEKSLAVCKAIIKAHDGELCAANCSESGTEYIFTLPAESKKD
ncbi:MAG: DUF4118 domain-containing protein [Lachnospiraceae bacterium]|nr:DUF4118 domain-containing protein [Lachnospiraceae bacterium]